MKQKSTCCRLNIYIILIFLLLTNFITIFYIILTRLPSIQQSSDSIEDNPIIINRNSNNGVNFLNNSASDINKQNAQMSYQQDVNLPDYQSKNKYFNIISQVYEKNY